MVEDKNKFLWTTKVTSKGQIVIPKEARDVFDIKEGDTVTVVMNEHVDYDGKQYPIASLPENLMSIIQAGGLVKAMRKLNGLD